MNLTDNDLQYEILVEGRVISKHPTKSLAEFSLQGLDEATKQKARIVPVTSAGKNVLLG